MAGNFRIAALIFISSILFAAPSYAQPDRNEKHLLVSMRLIGHAVLLNLGDSVSRVLPIEKDAGRYKIPFESQFIFNPKNLVSTIDSVIKKTGTTRNYIVEVEKCETKEVIYSYEIRDSTSLDLIPCGKRTPPRACYALFITLLDKSQSAASLNTNTYFALLIISPVILFGFLFYFRKKKPTAKPDRMPGNPDIILMGDFRFDKEQMTLYYGHEKTELSGKEADLLFLLYTNKNKAIERKHILNIVWGDEGDYIGRTLDVFVSKLRKKLEADPNVKIINIRGIGYKLITDYYAP